MPFISVSTWRCYTLKLTLGLLVSCAAAMAQLAAAEGEAPADGKVASIANLIDGLETRLERDPNDMKGWVLLAKSYQYMQRSADAKTAFENAVKLGYKGTLPEMGNAASAKPAVNSTHQQNGYMHAPLANAINEVTEKATEGASSPGIKVKVTLAPEAAKKLKGDELVFVFAKLPKGMPAPLAVAKKSVSDLPFEITLNDNMAMIPGHNISSASEVIVGARISMSGGVKKQGGDLEALSQAVPTTQKEQIVLAISE